MNENIDGYGRSADMDGEISDILSEVSGYTGKHSGDDSISELARRYGVSVSSAPTDGDFEPRSSEPVVSYRSQARNDDRVSYGQREKYDDHGARIVFDAGDTQEAAVGGRIAAGRAASSRSADNAVPLSVAERRRMIREKSANVRVLYDEDTATHASKEAPFDQIGDRPKLPPVSDGREHREKRERPERPEPKKPEYKNKKKKKNNKVQKSVSGDEELSRTRRIFKTFIPWNGDSRGECIRKIVMDVSFLVLLICALYFTNYFIELYEAIELNKRTHVDPPAVTQTVDENAEAWAQMRAKYPNVVFPEGMNIDYADLYGRNQDTVGYVNIEGTGIWGAVVKGEDNEFYLKHNFQKVQTKYGQIYMDYRNNTKELDDNTIIYGHHMRDGLMFAQLSEYYEDTKEHTALEFYKQHPVIEYSTLFAHYKWKICAVFVTNNKPSDDNGYMFNIIVPNFHTRESLRTYIDAVKERSIYDTGVDWNENDKFISLITCAYDFNDERLVVIARMVREGEPETVDVEKVTENENPRYPQKWYDVKGRKNPYRDAFRWEPNT
ncbi:MAG: class B sortase [Clostridia bacterium]|nr:class B sortase [Clostridia bacterium]